MTKQYNPATPLLLLSLMLLLGCSAQLQNRNPERGTIIVWHSWPEPESLLIEDLLDRFTEVHPGVMIVSEYVPVEQMHDQYVDQVQAGLGPDLLIGVSVRDLSSFIDLRLLTDLTNRVDTDKLSIKAVNALQLGTRQYGIPFAGSTPVLYFNRDIAADPPATLADFDKIAASEKTIAIPTTFRMSYWGVTTFGGDVLNDAGEITIDEGFTAWMEWLVSSAGKPSIVLSRDYDELRDLFAQGDVGYFIGDSLDFPYFREQLGEDFVGVAALPEFDKPAGAFLELEALAVSRVSAEIPLTVELIEFLTNPPHQREIALGDTGRVPINQLVRVDPRFSPEAFTFLLQSRKSSLVPLDYGPIGSELLVAGDTLYEAVLEGVVLPNEAGPSLIQSVNAALNPDPEELFSD